MCVMLLIVTYISGLNALILQVLINNAIVGQTPGATTEEGFEMQFGGNHIGHFLFTNLIISRLILATTPSFPSRIVNISSEAHTWNGAIRFDDPHFKVRPEEYTRYVAYSQSKTANILFSVELARRLADKNVLVFSLHPGGTFIL